jgi:hypothetical protein
VHGHPKSHGEVRDFMSDLDLDGPVLRDWKKSGMGCPIGWKTDAGCKAVSNDGRRRSLPARLT